MQIQRPRLLTVLAVLSFIGSGLSLFSNVMTLFFYDAVINIDVSELLAVYPKMFTEDILQSSLSVIEKAGRLYFMISAMAYIISLYGVYKMWNLQKNGLHYYAIAQIVILILPLIFVSAQLPVFSSLLITAIFILLYFKSFKQIEDE